jgi:hypothetical protein
MCALSLAKVSFVEIGSSPAPSLSLIGVNLFTFQRLVLFKHVLTDVALRRLLPSNLEATLRKNCESLQVIQMDNTCRLLAATSKIASNPKAKSDYNVNHLRESLPFVQQRMLYFKVPGAIDPSDGTSRIFLTFSAILFNGCPAEVRNDCSISCEALTERCTEAKPPSALFGRFSAPVTAELCPGRS